MNHVNHPLHSVPVMHGLSVNNPDNRNAVALHTFSGQQHPRGTQMIFARPQLSTFHGNRPVFQSPHRPFYAYGYGANYGFLTPSNVTFANFAHPSSSYAAGNTHSFAQSPRIARRPLHARNALNSFYNASARGPLAKQPRLTSQLNSAFRHPPISPMMLRTISEQRTVRNDLPRRVPNVLSSSSITPQNQAELILSKHLFSSSILPTPVPTNTITGSTNKAFVNISSKVALRTKETTETIDRLEHSEYQQISLNYSLTAESSANVSDTVSSNKPIPSSTGCQSFEGPTTQPSEPNNTSQVNCDLPSHPSSSKLERPIIFKHVPRKRKATSITEGGAVPMTSSHLSTEATTKSSTTHTMTLAPDNRTGSDTKESACQKSDLCVMGNTPSQSLSVGNNSQHPRTTDPEARPVPNSSLMKISKWEEPSWFTSSPGSVVNNANYSPFRAHKINSNLLRSATFSAGNVASFSSARLSTSTADNYVVSLSNSPSSTNPLISAASKKLNHSSQLNPRCISSTSITSPEECILWERKFFGRDNPQQLIYTLIFLLSRQLGLRTSNQLRQLRFGFTSQLQLVLLPQSPPTADGMVTIATANKLEASSIIPFNRCFSHTDSARNMPQNSRLWFRPDSSVTTTGKIPQDKFISFSRPLTMDIAAKPVTQFDAQWSSNGPTESATLCNDQHKSDGYICDHSPENDHERCLVCLHTFYLSKRPG